MYNVWRKIPNGTRSRKHRISHCGNNKEAKGFGRKTGEGEIDRRTTEGFGTPQKGYKLYQGNGIFSHERGSWQCVICGKRPKYEWAQIIGLVASTHGYKSREKNEIWGIPEEEKYKEEKKTKPKKAAEF